MNALIATGAILIVALVCLQKATGALDGEPFPGWVWWLISACWLVNIPRFWIKHDNQ